MNLESLRAFCRTLPKVTEDIKWGNDLCFLVAGKMFCVASLDPKEGGRASFKCSPEKFAELTERDSIIPAPYMARNHWVTLQSWGAMRDSEIKAGVRESYELVRSKLPKKVQLSLEGK